jgi:hypothetical protein
MFNRSGCFKFPVFHSTEWNVNREAYAKPTRQSPISSRTKATPRAKAAWSARWSTKALSCALGPVNHMHFRASVESFDELTRRNVLPGRFGRLGRAHWTETDRDSEIAVANRYL